MIEELQNSNNTINYLTLFIGWLLGLLSTFLIFFASRIFRKREISKGIEVELNSIKLRLAGVSFISNVEHGKVTREWTDWIKPYYEILADSSDFKYLKENPNKSLKLSTMSNEEFYNYLTLWNYETTSSGELTTPNFSVITLPFLEANYNLLSLFSKNYQTKIALLQRELSLFNSEIMDADFYHKKTFDSLSDINREIVVGNIRQIIGRISKKSKAIIKLIESIND